MLELVSYEYAGPVFIVSFSALLLFFGHHMDKRLEKRDALEKKKREKEKYNEWARLPWNHQKVPKNKIVAP